MFKLGLVLSLFGIAYAFEGQDDYQAVIEQVSDIHNPSVKDFEMMQAYLQSSRPYLKPIDYFNDFSRRSCRNMKIYDPNKPAEVIRIPANLPNPKKRVLITYCSLNGPYSEFVKQLGEKLKNYKRSFDCYFMVGGYPSTKEDGMGLFHIPYAWKVCMFKVIKDLGYNQILWIDSSMMPVRSLEPLFDLIDKNGRFFIPARGKNIGEFYRPYLNMYKEAIKACELEPKELMKMRHFQATIIGLDVKNPISDLYLEQWYELTRKTEASLTTLPEELVMSAIGYRLHLENDILPSNLFSYSYEHIQGCYFVQDTNR